MNKVLLIGLIIFVSLTTFAESQQENTKISKFATIRSDQVNTRVGPGLQYPVSVIFTSKGEPIEIIAEFNHWRRIKDVDGEVSWVHVSLLSRKRAVVMMQQASMCKKPYNDSLIIATVAPKVRCEFLDYCNKRWCKVRCKGTKGWVLRSCLWGIGDAEFQQSSPFMLYLKSIF